MKIVPIVVAVLFFIIAGLYGAGLVQFGTHTAGPHIKHAVLFGGLGVLALVWARFQSNQSTPAR